jgi:hypothetical protein
MDILPAHNRDKLFSARFIVTVALTLTFCKLALDGKVATEAYITVLIVTLNYYFAKKRPEDNGRG